MKLFSCHRCKQLLFFENIRCTRCGFTLAYLPDRDLMSGLQQESPAGPTWRALAPAAGRGPLPAVRQLHPARGL